MCCRVGIATGMVIIGDVAGVEEGGGDAIVGDAPDVAARLQMSAQPDTVAIDPATRRLIGNLFDCRDLGAIEANGGTEPMRIWQVLRPRILASRFEALHPSAPTPLVGRDEEIDLLLRRWERAKSGNGALFPFIDQLGRAAGFWYDDRPAAKLAKLEGLLVRATPPDEDVALLCDLLSLPAAARYPRSCKTWRTVLCCATPDSNCTRGSPKHSKPNPPSSWIPSLSSSRSITPGPGSLRNPPSAGARPAENPPPVQRWRKRRRNSKRG
jgi:hypothetical protein